jgi:hypothetical protein
MRAIRATLCVNLPTIRTAEMRVPRHDFPVALVEVAPSHPTTRTHNSIVMVLMRHLAEAMCVCSWALRSSGLSVDLVEPVNRSVSPLRTLHTTRSTGHTIGPPTC